MRRTDGSTLRARRGLAGLLLAAALTIGCTSRQPAPPDPSSDTYREAVRVFNVGLAALQTGDDARADTNLSRLTEIAPPEPAGWADLGLLSLRHREYDAAAQRIDRALALAPDNGRIHALRGLVESGRGKPDDAILHFRKAVDLAPDDLKARYALAEEIERAGTDDAEAQRVFQQILERRPDNLEALVEVVRLAAKRGDSGAMRDAVSRIAAQSASWPPDVQEKIRALQADDADPRAAAGRVAFLRNALLQTPEYRRSRAELASAAGVVGDPLDRFLWLPVPESAPAAPDEALRFDAEPIPGAAAGAWAWAGPVVMAGDAAPAIALAGDGAARVGDSIQLPFPGAPPSDGVLALDVDFDFKTDLVLAGPAGVRLYLQTAAGAMKDATAATKLSTEVTGGAYTGAWAADLESDGDLDVVLARRDGPPVELRNNGDGTFAALEPFAGVAGVRGFVWADVDGDGDADAAMTDAAGALHVFANERLGQFRRREAPAGAFAAIVAADADSDGRLDLVALGTDGVLARVSDDRDGGAWKTSEIGRLSGPVSAETARLFAADLDNNGSVDVAACGASGGMLWLGGAGGAFTQLDVLPHERLLAVADVTGDGRLDFVGLSADGRPVRAVNGGTKDYQWMELRPRARQTTGDRRVNSFGIGGQVEVRAGMLFEKLPIDAPVVHVGLGKYAEADVARITWPNGALQAEFELKVDTPVVFDQRLEGSCPWLFAYDGTKMRFVTDLIWRSPLGLRINAQDTGRVTQTEDWIKIRGDQLAPRDGGYDLSVTAELWETHFFDHLSLVVVDHPAGTEVFVDERFAVPPPKLEIQTTGPLHAVSGAWDDLGDDVTASVRAVDGTYLDTFGRGLYQGITRDHFVEVALDDEPETGPLLLVANGWIHPTDSSINVAVGQGGTPPPAGLSLEVPDGRGGWVVARSGLGFPEGKNKTILVSLDGVFRPGAPRRVRLRTNLEIYWDSIAWAEARPGDRIATRRLAADVAELRYRGFSLVGQADASSPELPDYDRIAGTRQRWADLVGFYTRFGDVRELVAGVDDRYVIMNAGDELLLRFAAPAPPADGWVRDFVLVGDGWVKDGNFNTTFSKTVLPLPLHDRPDYATPPGRLEDDPAYQRHPEDWSVYHTRYVTPDDVRAALRP